MNSSVQQGQSSNISAQEDDSCLLLLRENKYKTIVITVGCGVLESREFGGSSIMYCIEYFKYTVLTRHSRYTRGGF